MPMCDEINVITFFTFMQPIKKLKKKLSLQMYAILSCIHLHLIYITKFVNESFCIAKCSITLLVAMSTKHIINI
jgi:hypothetical protein